ncbi:MAG: transcription elongation factor GreA [Spirochaetes bacterium]|nr:transcription elongation factor GreA [Spirochaetota bacterium]
MADIATESTVAKRLREMLNEEKWTRATLGAYSISNLKELDALFHEASGLKVLDEVRDVCDEHLGHSKNSIIALYLSGVIALARQQIDDSNMVSLINIFVDNKKWQIVEFICERILEFGENRYALQKLAECYQSEDRDNDMYTVWERLIRIDYEEADIVKFLAEKAEKDGRTDDAREYYRKALHRYIGKGLFTNVKEIWNKLLEYCPDDIDFFLHVQRKIAKQISEDKAAGLLFDLYKHYKSIESWDIAIDILKVVISYDEKNPLPRKEIVECYRGKFAGHSNLEEYIRVSNLSQSYRSLSEAIGEFEKHIAFDVGNFVYHRTWNIGRIADIRSDEITVDFAKNRGHVMGLKMAIDSLITLSRDHIWVLKAVWSKEKLHDKVVSDHAWVLKTVIKSFDNCADLKKIKAELVPSILTDREWTGWSSKARKVLKEDPLFGNAKDDINSFIVRDRTLSFDEKTYNHFKAETNFFARVSCMRDFMEKGDPDSDYFAEMLAFFTGFTRMTSQINEYVVSAYLLLKEIATKYPHLKANLSISLQFGDIFNDIDDVVAIYDGIRDTELRRYFLQHIRNFVPEWPDVYARILPYSLSQAMLEILAANGHIEKLKAMVLSIVENYRDHREAFVWVVKNLWGEVWVKELGLSYEKIVITMLHILDISFKEIENHRDTTENRKINKQIHNLLFKENALTDFLAGSDHDTIERVYMLLTDIKDLDPAIKIQMKKYVIDRFPDFKFSGEEEKTVVSRGLIVTTEKYSEKQKLLQEIMEVDVPANQREIAFALSLGDLRENAEYKAAREKQDELNTKVGKLKNEIERAQIFDKSTISTSKVTFGTMVTLKNELIDTEERYTILGPWESDPANNIISYLSPLGKKLINHKVGERVAFVIHERKFQYSVLKIEAAQL